MRQIWRWLVRGYEGDRTQLREAFKPIALRVEPPRTRQVYATSDGRERISHVFRVLNLRKRRAS